MIIPNKNKTPILPVIKAIGKSPRTVIKKVRSLEGKTCEMAER